MTVVTPADAAQPAHTNGKTCLNRQPKDKHIATFEPTRADHCYVPNKFMADAITCECLPLFSKSHFFLSVELTFFRVFFTAAGKRAADTNRMNHVEKRLRLEHRLADQELPPDLTTSSVHQHLLFAEYAGQGVDDAHTG